MGAAKIPTTLTLSKLWKLTEQELKEGFLDVSIPSDAYNTVCTSNAGMVGDTFTQTRQTSTKVFTVSDGHLTPGSMMAKLHHPLQEPAQTVDTVPVLADQSLLSGNKFAKAGYVSICDDVEVNIYDGRIIKIVVSKASVLKGRRYPRTRMCCVPLQHNFTNLNTDTLLINIPTGTESLNSAYTVPSGAQMLGHIMACFEDRLDPVGAINNVYDLPSIEPSIRYLHGATEFSTKATWLKDIRNGNCLTWLLVDAKT